LTFVEFTLRQPTWQAMCYLKGELTNAQLQKELELEKIKGKMQLKIKRLEWELEQIKDKMELELEQIKGKMELEKELELERLRSDIRANHIKFKGEIESLTNDHVSL
jgi:hypothetical protein